jgi:hypothetical protein
MIEVVVLIADTVPTIQADSKAVRYPTVGIEVAGGKTIRGAGLGGVSVQHRRGVGRE